jgi:hypothetical protein
MIRLKQLEDVMRPNFIWMKDGQKILQTLEEIEGAKDLGRMIFVGLAEMHGFDSVEVQKYLDMSYDSYRHKIQQFRENWKQALRRVNDGTIYLIEDPIKKFYLKVSLCLNAIYWQYKTNPYLELKNWMTYE